jgi:tRNA 2-selenouridine synthase SelU
MDIKRLPNNEIMKGDRQLLTAEKIGYVCKRVGLRSKEMQQLRLLLLASTIKMYFVLLRTHGERKSGWIS